MLKLKMPGNPGIFNLGNCISSDRLNQKWQNYVFEIPHYVRNDRQLPFLGGGGLAAAYPLPAQIV
jgi:hypothetical protein